MISVVEPCKEHPFEELLAVGQCRLGEEGSGDIEMLCVLNVKLGGNSLDISNVRAGMSGYHTPPLISCLTIGKGNKESENIIFLDLARSVSSGSDR